MQSCRALGKRDVWREVCSRAENVDGRSAASVRSFFASGFDAYRVLARRVEGDRELDTRDSGLMTGYYEPLLRGSRARSERFATPVYRVPDDLLVIDLGSVHPEVANLRLRGKLQGRRVVPYPSRGEITGTNLLAGQELLWVDDPVDAFFLQVQGSGRVRFDDGSMPKTRRPAPVALHLREEFPSGRFFPGTLVASARGQLPDAGREPPNDVPAPQGLEVVLDVHGKPRHSVRGIIVHRDYLYVADEAGDAVKIFEVATGRLTARIRGKRIRKPVHLILHGETLYIGAAGTGSILAYDIPREPPRGKLKARVVIDGKLRAPSGFAIGPDGDFYVAERFEQRVRRFTSEGKKRDTFIDGLPDVPEFLLHVPNRL